MTALFALAVAGLAALSAADEAPAPPPGEAATDVLLVGAPGHLVTQLRRELEAAGFAVRAVDRAPDGGGPALSVVVSDRNRRVQVQSHGEAGDAVLADLTVGEGGDDKLARRRACLAVVERLRLAREADDARLETSAVQDAAAPPALVFGESAAPALAAETHAPPWSLGFASTLNLDSSVGEPTSHVQVLGELPTAGPLSFWARASWPVVGAQFQTDGRFVRMWTMGLTTGIHLYLRDPARVRPYAGFGVGARFVLADSDVLDTRESRVTFTPAATAAAQAGLLIEVRPLVHMVAEVEVEVARRLPVDRLGYEAAAANARSGHIALGVLFDY